MTTHMNRLVYCIGIILFVLTSCTPTAVREAQATIAMADSLRAEGVSLSDSAALADAVSSLRPWRYLYRDDYARANYYYGRYLRSVGNQPAAMQCFIDATHSHSHDYEILGRVYTNMGVMCELEGNYHLSGRMYTISSQHFFLAMDSLAYYYALNDIAVSHALNKNKTESFNILKNIEANCHYNSVIEKSIETRAICFQKVGEHDSALFYSNILQNIGKIESTGYIIKAQTFHELNMMDSSLYYAQKVLELSVNLADCYNALYILSHDDTTLSSSQVLDLTSARADLQMEYTRRQESLAQAIQLLQQDLSRPYDWRWIHLIVGLVGAIFTIFGLSYVQHRYIATRRESLAINQERIDYLRRTCCELSTLPQTQLVETLHWNNEHECRAIVNARMMGVVDKLESSYPQLSFDDIRFCILVLLDIPYAEMADILHRSQNSIGKRKALVGKKMRVSMANLRPLLLKIAIQKPSNRDNK